MAAIVTAQQALAATSLCVGSGTTGFDWVEGAWKPVQFATENYLIKEIASNDPIGLMCYADLEGEGLWAENGPGQFFGPSWSCFARADVGTDLTLENVVRCRKFTVAEGVVGAVDCTFAGTVRYNFQPNGEIVTTRTYAALLQPSATGSRDSLALSIGKCTVIAP